ncbi:IS5 family transposase [Salinibacterium sp.]|uniref:IS5 family transposase n=1 Tax=Salinibacterium sp. TaxID=1915057 RepID=UPI0037CB5357
MWWRHAESLSRTRSSSDGVCARIELLMPAASRGGGGGRPVQDHRRVVEGIVWRFRTGAPWRDLPAGFGPWQTAWKRHRRFSGDGTWDRIHAELLADAAAAGELDWAVSVDSATNRSRGGLSTKIHQLVDGRGLVVLVGAGQARDSPIFPMLMEHLSITRRGPAPDPIGCARSKRIEVS